MADENGNFYALGMSMSISGLIYNKDALDKAGVDPNSIRTWDDFDAACEKLVAAGITPLAIGGSVGGNLVACSAPLPRPSGRTKAPSMIWATL